jgi:hypothetical protein
MLQLPLNIVDSSPSLLGRFIKCLNIKIINLEIMGGLNYFLENLLVFLISCTFKKNPGCGMFSAPAFVNPQEHAI